jgi:hypothetical protein
MKEAHTQPGGLAGGLMILVCLVGLVVGVAELVLIVRR